MLISTIHIQVSWTELHGFPPSFGALQGIQLGMQIVIRKSFNTANSEQNRLIFCSTSTPLYAFNHQICSSLETTFEFSVSSLGHFERNNIKFSLNANILDHFRETTLFRFIIDAVVIFVRWHAYAFSYGK